MRFEFATATRVVFGRGALDSLGAAARELGTRALVVTGRSTVRGARAIDQLSGAGIAATAYAVACEPDLSTVERGVALARATGCDLVVGIGGGSAVDTAKAVAALLTNPGALADYLEVVGAGQPLTHPPAPCVAIPTTAGTGSEVTRNAVLASPAHLMKVSLRSPLMLPRLAIVDPELAREAPAAITATTGLDALTQLIEPYLSLRANPLVDALCRDGLRRAPGALRRACADGQDMEAREEMAYASLLGGLALANAGLGAVHGLAGPLGGLFGAPHGALCAALLPHVLDGNLRAIEARAPDHPMRARFDELARLITARDEARARDGIAWLHALVQELAIPPLRAHGVAAVHLPDLVAQARRASSMKGNPIELTANELTAIVEAAL